METLVVQCCIAGGGPAGMMLGYLLARAGVEVLVLEKHADFLRDFRGDTVHPSTMQIMKELGLLEEFLKLPHSRIPRFEADIGHQSFKVADFTNVPIECRFIALMPQWEFLNFLREKSRRFPSLSLRMSTEVESLIEVDGRVRGVHARGPSGPLDVEADLVVGCDGRQSTVRRAAGLAVDDLGSPIDVLWFRLSKRAGDPKYVLGHLGVNKMVVTIDRTDYWQCAFVIAKGGVDEIHRAGIEAFRVDIADGVPFLADRIEELKSFVDVKLLSVSVDRLTTWSRPGLLCIGDAAHAMSPVGGVGINLAIQDAVATANLLAAKLGRNCCRDEDLDAVRRRRLWPVKVVQRAQVAVHNRVLRPAVAGSGRTAVPVPWPVRLLDRFAWLRRWPAQVIGVGLRPEHVRSPDPPMHPVSVSHSNLTVAGHLFAVAALLFVVALHQLPTLFAGLLVYALVDALAPGVQRHVPAMHAHRLVVASLAVLVVGILTLAIAAAIAYLNSENGNPTLFFERMTPLIERARAQLPTIVVDHLPDNSAEVRAAVMDWSRTHTAQLQLAGKHAVRVIVQLLVGIVLGAMLALHGARARPPGGPLTVVLKARCAHLVVAFRDVVFAQAKISGLNTFLTGAFLLIGLPLFGIALPLAKTLVMVTFVVGLLPVIGNLISNTLIVVAALSISMSVAFAALVFLIVIHKLEYFLSARIIGTQIQAFAWELLIAMLVMETLFGVAGLIAAPIYYAYLKRELAAAQFI